MELLDDLMLSLRGEDCPVKNVHTCVFWTAVISKHCGLSSTFREAGPSHERGVRDAGSLTQRTALELAEYARSDSLLEASIGMATINSLIQTGKSAGMIGLDQSLADLVAQDDVEFSEAHDKCLDKDNFKNLVEKRKAKDLAT